MAYKAFSDEWAQAYKDEINNSAVYKQAAAAWEGVVALIVEAEPDGTLLSETLIRRKGPHGEEEVRFHPADLDTLRNLGPLGALAAALYPAFQPPCRLARCH